MTKIESFHDVLLVIPCLNEEEHLPGLLDVLLRDTPGALIVVADGGSHDCSRQIVLEYASRHPGVRLLDNPAKLQSAGVNLAARKFGRARKWLVRVDAHCGYPPAYVACLITVAIEHQVTSVVVPMKTQGNACFQKAAAAAQNSVLGTGGSAHRHVGKGGIVDHGHHALMRLDRFLAVGGYCERFAANEDAELDHRLQQAGGRIWLEPAAAVDYFPRRRPAALFRQYFRYGTGRAMTIRRHRMRLKLRQILPTMIAPAVLFAALAPLGGWWLALPALAWMLACIGYGALLGFRKREGCVAMAGAAAMVMHLAWALGFWLEMLLRPPLGPPPGALLPD